MSKNIKTLTTTNLNAKDEFDFKTLCIEEQNFVQILNITHNFETTFEFNVSNLQSFEQIQNFEMLTKIKLLLNVAKFENLYKDFNFSLSPTNLMYEQNLNPKILLRDIQNQNENKQVFVDKYLALIVCVLNSKVTYKQARENLNTVLSKQKTTQIFFNVNTTQQICEKLYQLYLTFEQNQNQQIIQVSKKKYFYLKVFTTLTTLISISALVFGIYFGMYKFQQENLFNKINQQYIQSDYSSIINDLINVSPLDMDKTTKFELALSFINTENINSGDKNQFISEISINSNSDILHF